MTAPDPALLERLAAHRAIGGAPRAEHEWLVAHGEIKEIPANQVVSAKGEPIPYLYVVLEGHIAIYPDRGGAEQRMAEWRAGDLAGILPYSRLVKPPGWSKTLEATTVLAVHRDHFPELIRECPQVTASCVHSMLDRARWFTSGAMHDEKLTSLGKLSAGIAHELNNPAAAIERSASQLQNRVEEVEEAARALGAAGLTQEQLAAVAALRESCVMSGEAGLRSPLQRAEREEAIADWLADHGLDEDASESLAETGVRVEDLENVARAVQGPALEAALRWAAAACAARTLTNDIHEASMRISGLVLAVKGFTHMDQASVAEAVDLGRGLGNTIAVLRSKARSKSATLAVDLPADLPRARGVVGELNQIWANLIDNALDAIEPSGRIEVAARAEGDRIVVRIVDDGPGIPPEIRERIFEPFFTTKPMGQGTGLGLDIVRRLALHNEGVVAVDSRPGRTEFRVSLPLAPVAADAPDGAAPTGGRG